MGADARGRPWRPGADLAAEEVAQVASARRERMLRVHRHRLGREDLEDCFSQATLELLAGVGAGGRFAGSRHVANVLEQRFLSRVHDQRRALSGRSPMVAALAGAASLSGPEDQTVEVVDVRAELEKLVILRQELRRVQVHARALTPEQQLVLASQVGLQESSAEFCRRHGWSAEKYRKVAQRARARLRALRASEERDVPSARGSSEQHSGTYL